MEEVVNFFDTNVLIAASISHHPHHSACSSRLAKLRNTSGVCASHTLAEAYSSLTRAGKGYGLPPLEVTHLLEDAATAFTVVSLSPLETLQAIKASAERGLHGPLVYDALLLACARKVDAKAIYTNDLGDLRRIAPDLASRIRLP